MANNRDNAWYHRWAAEHQPGDYFWCPAENYIFDPLEREIIDLLFDIEQARITDQLLSCWTAILELEHEQEQGLDLILLPR